LGFFAISPFKILVIGTASFFLLALYDKFIILKFTKPFKLKSFEYGMNLLKPFSWDLSSYFTTMACYTYYLMKRAEEEWNLNKNGEYAENYQKVYWLVLRVFIAVAGFLVLSFFILRVNLKDRVRSRFDKENSHVHYDTVVNSFGHTYKKEYPFGNLAS